MKPHSGKNKTKVNAARAAMVCLWLTAPIAILVAVAAGSELLVDGLLRDNANFVAQALGQDIVTLAVALVMAVVFGVVSAISLAMLVWYLRGYKEPPHPTRY